MDLPADPERRGTSAVVGKGAAGMVGRSAPVVVRRGDADLVGKRRRGHADLW